MPSKPGRPSLAEVDPLYRPTILGTENEDPPRGNGLRPAKCDADAWIFCSLGVLHTHLWCLFANFLRIDDELEPIRILILFHPVSDVNGRPPHTAASLVQSAKTRISRELVHGDSSDPLPIISQSLDRDINSDLVPVLNVVHDRFLGVNQL